MEQDQIRERIEEVQAEIAAAAQRAGRNPADITLVAVTKTHPASVVAAAQAAGLVDMGENRVQEAEGKITELADPRIRWHLIGQLQRNKARRAAALFALVHSVDNLRLAEALDRAAAEEGRGRLPILLQIGLAGEAQKGGFWLPGGLEAPEFLAFLTDVAAILKLPNLDVQGLMTVPPYNPDPEQSRPFFRQLRAVADDLRRRFPQSSWPHLSMGMSGDFAVAVEEGATLVRVGTALFGSRG